MDFFLFPSATLSTYSNRIFSNLFEFIRILRNKCPKLRRGRYITMFRMTGSMRDIPLRQEMVKSNLWTWRKSALFSRILPTTVRKLCWRHVQREGIRRLCFTNHLIFFRRHCDLTGFYFAFNIIKHVLMNLTWWHL